MWAFLLACADSPDATLDDDNWLSGDLVEEFHPKIASVHILAKTEADDEGWHQFEVDYLDADEWPLVMVRAGWMEAEDGSIVIDSLNYPTVAESFSGGRYGSQHPPVTVTLDMTRDTLTGTFAVFEGSALGGGFGGTIDWDNWD